MGLRTGRVTGRRTGKNRDSKDTTRLLQVIVTDRNDVRTVQLASHTGEESNPPDGSLVAIIAAGESLKIALATSDFIVPVLDVGGKRIYSTDDTGTAVKAEIRLDPDGKITVTNPGASITITPAGQITIEADGDTIITSNKTTINNDVQINGDLDVSGTITAPNVVGTTDVSFGGISSLNHVHPQGADSDGDSQQNTGVAQ